MHVYVTGIILYIHFKYLNFFLVMMEIMHFCGNFGKFIEKTSKAKIENQNVKVIYI